MKINSEALMKKHHNIYDIEDEVHASNFTNALPKSLERKSIWVAFIGNVLEWYDFAVYGYLAAVISKVFFPGESPAAQMLMSYGVFAAGFFARPLGAVFFGYMGDVHGRKKALLMSVFLMAIPTTLIGLLPTYKTIGLMAPLLLILIRLTQGISIGGEFSGSIVYLAENAPKNKRGLMTSWADLGCSSGVMLGLIVATILNYVLTAEDLQSWGWRLPFLSGILLGGVGIYIRKNLPETNIFLKDTRSVAKKENPFLEVFRAHKRNTLAVMFGCMINGGGFYLCFVFLPNSIISKGELSAHASFLLSIFSMSIFMVAMMFAAWWSDYVGRKKILWAGQAICALIAYPLMIHSATDILYQALLQGIFAIGIGFCFGPRSSLLTECFPTKVRLSSISLGFNASNAIFGGTAPFIAAYLIQETGLNYSPAFYIILASCVSAVAIYFLKQTHQENL